MERRLRQAPPLPEDQVPFRGLGLGVQAGPTDLVQRGDNDRRLGLVEDGSKEDDKAIQDDKRTRIYRMTVRKNV